MDEGQSFEGLVVNLQCRGDYVAYPNQIKCRRKGGFPDSGLEWSHVPLCYPSVLVSKTHWTKVLHARSVSCVGDSKTGTTCKLTCIREEESHTCILVLLFCRPMMNDQKCVSSVG